MRRKLSWLLAALITFAPEAVFAQSSPNLATGQVPTAAQWNGFFTVKQDVLLGGANSVLANPTGLPAPPVFTSMPDCHGATNALIWTPSTGFGCNTGGGGVSSVGSAGTLVVSPTTGAVIADLNLSSVNTWLGAQTFSGGLSATTGAFSTALGAASGGTGLATLTAHSILAGNGVSAVTLLAPGTAGNVLTSNGAGADPTFQALGAGGDVTSVSNSDGTLTISPTTGAVVASLALGHANTWSGAQAFGVLTASTPVAATSGGTGHASYTAHMSLVATSTTALTGKVLPDCPDTSGQHLNFTQGSDAYSCGTTSGGAPGGGATMPYLSKSADYSAANTDNGSLLEVTSAAVLTLQTTGPTMTAGWFIILSNIGTNTAGWTITPSSGTIDGVASTYSYTGEVRLIEYDGTNFHSKVYTPFAEEFLSSGAGSIIWPTGYNFINWDLVGGGAGGASGGSGSSNGGASGGGAGGRKPGQAKAPSAGTTINFTVAAAAVGGAAVANAVGNPGAQGNTTVLTGYDIAGSGAPGIAQGSGGGGGGGLGSASLSTGGAPASRSGAGDAFGSGGGNAGLNGDPSSGAGHNAEWGGAGGGLGLIAGGAGVGGSSYYGPGAGGGGCDGTHTAARGGTSHSYSAGGGGAVGTSGTPPTAGGAGTAGSWGTNTSGAGGGGGGCATTMGFNGAPGGAGGQPGGGGGAGGWTPDTSAAGNKGGDGAAGAVRLWGG